MQTLSLDRLGDEIAELAPHLDAATARLLDPIRVFDARAGWNTGFTSCAAWLSWRVGLAPGAAREHVRVARALGTGRRAAPPRSRISLCSVAGTTAPSTRRATSSTDNRTASFDSVAPTAGSCPRSRLLPRCSAMPCRSCERGTMQRGSSYTRTPRPRVG